MRICLSDPRAGYLAHRVEIDAAVARVLKGGEYILGPEVDAFEEEFARFLGAQSAVSTGNGTDAIELALRALSIGRGDIVITTSNTAVATVAAIELSGASALLVEVDERTLTISPEHFEQALRDHKGRGIKAVVPVHLFGQPADLPAISEIAHRHGVVLIEDAAQAHGASINGRQVGAWGDAAAFSFYPTKNLDALGDGGAVVTNDGALAVRLREFAGVLYPIPIHQQPGYRGRIETASELPVTERAARELLCLPVHPWLRDEEVEEIACAVRSFFRQGM